MSEGVDWTWVRTTLRQTQAEQRALRGMIEPVAPRLSALEARFAALEARLGGIEESVNGIGLTLREQGELLAHMARKLLR